MRSLQECQTEIFLRSEQRLKVRKKRRLQTLMWCVPLCLCMLLCAVTVIPAMMPAGADLVGNSAPENAGAAVVAVEIRQSGDAFLRHEDAPTVTAIHCAILDLYNAAVVGGTGDGNSESSPEGGVSAGTLPPDYTITFIAENGTVDVFTLSGNTLTDETAAQTIALSPQQLSDLLAVLQPNT